MLNVYIFLQLSFILNEFFHQAIYITYHFYMTIYLFIYLFITGTSAEELHSTFSLVDSKENSDVLFAISGCIHIYFLYFHSLKYRTYFFKFQIHCVM